MANTRITEKKAVDIKRTVCSNPVYLAWHFKGGGTDYWLFDSDREIEDVDSDFETYSTAIEDLETATAITHTLQKQGVQRYILEASELTTQQYNGLINIIYAAKVKMWLPDKQDWQPVFIIPGTHQRRLRQSLSTLSLTISTQPIFTVRQ